MNLPQTGGCLRGKIRYEITETHSTTHTTASLKEHLMARWGIRRWSELDSKIGDMFQDMLAAIRYAVPSGDTNRSRWPNHPVWGLVSCAATGDLCEMTSGADPQRVKTVRRDHLQGTLIKQIIGNAATLSITTGLEGDRLEDLPSALAITLDNFMREHPERFDEKRARAAERYHFVERPCRKKCAGSKRTDDDAPF
jgi:hypothetical protein